MFRSAVLLLSVLLAACTFAQTQAPADVPLPTPTSVRVVQTTAVPTFSRQLQTIDAAETQSSSARASEDGDSENCEATAGQPTASHTVEATLAYREQRVSVTQHTRYINRMNAPLETIVLNVEPNRIPSVVNFQSVSFANGEQASYELAGRRMTLELPDPVTPGCTVELTLEYTLQIPPIGQGISAFNGYFGFSARQINLAHWLLSVAVRQDGDWITHDVATVGEQTVYDPADWDVTLTVEGASDQLMLAAPGTVTQNGPGIWRIVQTGARELTLSLSEQFRLTTQETPGGVTVEAYTFDDAQVQTDQGMVDGAAHALDMAARSLDMYSDLFGEYPRDRFVLVQGDFPDGMEFSDIVFVGGDWFRSYNGQPTSYLTIITVHEVAHQWWYSRVGSDQALTPWLDESLATYSEYIFYEEYFPELKDWWWQFRVNTFIPPGFDDHSVASTVYEFQSVREYINAVYLRGARMLDDLRRDLGTQAFFDWLRAYAEAGSGRVATPDLFWSLLSEQQMAAIRETREQYLGKDAVVAAVDS